MGQLAWCVQNTSSKLIGQSVHGKRAGCDWSVGRRDGEALEMCLKKRTPEIHHISPILLPLLLS